MSDEKQVTSQQTEEQPEIVRLNIGGKRFTTTKTTLLSRGENFFTPLLSGKMKSRMDETGAFFIDRNGSYFECILDFLRHGELIIPSKVKQTVVRKEADFYGINVVPGLCGNIKEGLYMSSNWIIFLERDPHHPWIFGITGVEDDKIKDKKNVFFKLVCSVDSSTLRWNYNNIDYEIYSHDDKVYIWNPSAFDSRSQLFFRCPKMNKFPLEVSEILASDETFDGKCLNLKFAVTPQGAVFTTTEHPTNVKDPIVSDVEVLCRRLLIMHVVDDDKKVNEFPTTLEKSSGNRKRGDWLLYSHSDLAFFCFGHRYLPFGSSFHRV